MKITAISNWYGSNRMLAAKVGKLLEGCSWVGVPFGGSLCELAHIKCRTGVANDLHSHLINLASIIAHSKMGSKLIRRLRRVIFHPVRLEMAQRYCMEIPDLEPDCFDQDRLVKWAESFFIVSWMSRSGTAGTKKEFDGKLSFRWEAGGGDSVVRFRNAIEGLQEWRGILSKWTFDCRDAFEFIAKCKDQQGHGIYADPPFFDAGDLYKFDCGKTEAEQIAWHNGLAAILGDYKLTRVVVRAYDIPLMHDLYPEDRWKWHRLTGRKQTNDAAPELLLTLNA